MSPFYLSTPAEVPNSNLTCRHTGYTSMSPLTDRTWTFLRKVFQFSRWFHFHALLWNENEKYPELMTSGPRLVPWYFCALTTFLYYGFVIVRAIQTSLNAHA